jgi:predicted nucleic acid-binding protein
MFIALEKRDRSVTALAQLLKRHATIFVAASTLAEVWRDRDSSLGPAFSWLRPSITSIDATLGKRAGNLLARSKGDASNTLDAMVVATAEKHRADEIYTSDAQDIDALLSASAIRDCAVVAI